MKLSNLFTRNIDYNQAKNLDDTCRKINRFNIHYGGWSMIALSMCIGGTIFTAGQGNLSRLALGMVGGSLFSVGVYVLVDQTVDDVIDDCIEVISKGQN